MKRIEKVVWGYLAVMFGLIFGFVPWLTYHEFTQGNPRALMLLAIPGVVILIYSLLFYLLGEES